jgi:SAM-dependent methyltransferase
MIWKQGLGDELRFWSRYVETDGLQWKESYAERLNPHLPLQTRIREIIHPAPGQAIKILDVGAGPLTILGKTWEGHDLSITAVDPLADSYTALLQGKGITPPIPTELCRAEELTAKFPRNEFDLVYARNCMDHSEDPLQSIQEMLEVCKSGGRVLLDHWPDEGEKEEYRGLHQWNFRCEGGDFVIWNKRSRVNVTQVLSDKCKVECRMEMDAAEAREMVVVVLSK